MTRYNIILIVIFSLLISCSQKQQLGIGDQTYDKENWIIYNDSIQITKDDFKANPDNESGPFYSYMQIVSDIDCKNGKVIHKSYAAFNKNKSWISSDFNSFDLKKQQLRFKLYEIFAQKLDKAIKEQITTCSQINSKRDSIGKRNFIELNDFEERIISEFKRVDNDEELYQKLNKHFDDLLKSANLNHGLSPDRP